MKNQLILISGLQLQDIRIHGRMGAPGYLLTAGRGSVEQVSFENIHVGGEKLNHLSWQLGLNVPPPIVR